MALLPWGAGLGEQRALPLVLPCTLAVTAQLCRLAVQLALLPPCWPLQDQLQGPLPVTLLAVPALQRFVVGALVNI